MAEDQVCSADAKGIVSTFDACGVATDAESRQWESMGKLSERNTREHYRPLRPVNICNIDHPRT